MKKIMLITFAATLLAGCATKQYPQTPSLSTEEMATFDCKTIEQEIAKAKSIQTEIEKTGQLDGKTALGALGDLGIGNGMAKSNARTKVNDRLNQLELLKISKCKQ